MIDHMSLPITDIARSRAFYDAVLAPLGYARVMDEDHAEYVASGYGPDGGDHPEPTFWIGAGVGDDLSVPRLPDGFHLAFAAPDRATVDAFHAAALAAGGQDNGAPGLRHDYHPNYYAAFVIDPDGVHIEAVCHTPTGG